jgi:hypothetical protein
MSHDEQAPKDEKIEIPRSYGVDQLAAHLRERLREIQDLVVRDLPEKETNIQRGRYAELEELFDKFSFPKGIEP